MTAHGGPEPGATTDGSPQSATLPAAPTQVDSNAPRWLLAVQQFLPKDASPETATPQEVLRRFGTTLLEGAMQASSAQEVWSALQDAEMPPEEIRQLVQLIAGRMLVAGRDPASSELLPSSPEYLRDADFADQCCQGCRELLKAETVSARTIDYATDLLVRYVGAPSARAQVLAEAIASQLNRGNVRAAEFFLTPSRYSKLLGEEASALMASPAFQEEVQKGLQPCCYQLGKSRRLDSDLPSFDAVLGALRVSDQRRTELVAHVFEDAMRSRKLEVAAAVREHFGAALCPLTEDQSVALLKSLAPRSRRKTELLGPREMWAIARLVPGALDPSAEGRKAVLRALQSALENGCAESVEVLRKEFQVSLAEEEAMDFHARATAGFEGLLESEPSQDIFDSIVAFAPLLGTSINTFAAQSLQHLHASAARSALGLKGEYSVLKGLQVLQISSREFLTGSGLQSLLRGITEDLSAPVCAMRAETSRQLSELARAVSLSPEQLEGCARVAAQRALSEGYVALGRELIREYRLPLSVVLGKDALPNIHRRLATEIAGGSAYVAQSLWSLCAGAGDDLGAPDIRAAVQQRAQAELRKSAAADLGWLQKCCRSPGPLEAAAVDAVNAAVHSREWEQVGQLRQRFPDLDLRASLDNFLTALAVTEKAEDFQRGLFEVAKALTLSRFDQIRAVEMWASTNLPRGRLEAVVSVVSGSGFVEELQRSEHVRAGLVRCLEGGTLEGPVALVTLTLKLLGTRRADLSAKAVSNLQTMVIDAVIVGQAVEAGDLAEALSFSPEELRECGYRASLRAALNGTGGGGELLGARPGMTGPALSRAALLEVLRFARGGTSTFKSEEVQKVLPGLLAPWSELGQQERQEILETLCCCLRRPGLMASVSELFTLFALPPSEFLAAGAEYRAEVAAAHVQFLKDARELHQSEPWKHFCTLFPHDPETLEIVASKWFEGVLRGEEDLWRAAGLAAPKLLHLIGEPRYRERLLRLVTTLLTSSRDESGSVAGLLWRQGVSPEEAAPALAAGILGRLQAVRGVWEVRAITSVCHWLLKDLSLPIALGAEKFPTLTKALAERSVHTFEELARECSRGDEGARNILAALRTCESTDGRESSGSGRDSQSRLMTGYDSAIDDLLCEPSCIVSRPAAPFYTQTVGYTCGPASARMGVEAVTGLAIDEQRMMEILDTTEALGTPLGNFNRLGAAIPEVEVRVGVDSSWDELRSFVKSGYTIILNYTSTSPHYSVVRAITDTRVLLHDPAQRPSRIVNRSDLQWRGGYGLTGTRGGYCAIRAISR